MSTRDERMQDFFVRTAEHVLKYGWAIQGVFPVEGGEHHVPFAYTIGLTIDGLPELMMSGPFPPEQLQTWLNEAATKHSELELLPGDVIDYLANVPFKVIAADANTAPIQQCFNYLGDPQNKRKKVKLLQIIWPDADGNYPGDPGWPEEKAQEIWPA